MAKIQTHPKTGAQLFDRKKGSPVAYYLKCPTCGKEHKQTMNEKPDSKWIYCREHKVNRHKDNQGYAYGELEGAR